ncbi:LysR family transcriptional regulator [Phenylobacterium aquaticum]|uniref:LysR family transcriptional regulator n=1 Tax=Phenylobacterium aquaticum TaxID=1763816 RepID=UPI0026EDF1E0|nr:LysR family transcriptional regulator [Phenylobacterium aquaticum]
MEIQQLRHLAAAVQFGNLLKAAEESHISQSGLSRSIKSLETRLGVPLLIRKPKGVEPTIFGLSVLQRAKVILNEVSRSVREVRDLQAARIGEVTFGITQNYANYFIPQVLAELHRVAPEVRVTVKTSGFLEMLEAVQAGAIEFGFGLLGAMEEIEDISITPLFEHHSRVIANAKHPLAGRPVSPQELSLARWATLSGEGFQRNFINFFHVRGLPLPAQIVRTDSIALIRHTLSDIEALTILPADVVLSEVDAGEFVILDCETPAELTRVGLLRRADDFVSPQTKLVMDLIVKAIGPYTMCPED